MTSKKFAERFPLRSISYSQKACFIRFVGGPANGRVELYDNDQYTAIVFAPYEYRPSKKRGVYRFTRKYGAVKARKKGGAP